MLKNISNLGSTLNKLAQKNILGGVKLEFDCISHAHFCNNAHTSNADYDECMADCGCE
ncbi:hypothetical protein SAMN04487765_3738 [Tenacibaculum sp. MAR_2010_89]|uniref:hypothetical protein n=1 Tax=Tenacibaculum sp. MAR_2010_89 TaxID=1250198 RepID=UPI000895AB0F|nr:hypothetical protein [Tenacibaculum sp. MAR_2010_89]SEE67421.1 hypothetical protein SAMN04487765_3738 [Tenacibaculum sp. MAR_2010_89]